MVAEIDVGTLARLVIHTAKMDTTAPESGNLRNGWMTDLLLTQMIDRFVVGQRNKPAVYARIGKWALDYVRELPEAAALVQLAILRGERMLPLTKKREQALLQMIDDLRKVIDALPEGTRKTRCKSLFDYHQGVFYDSCGRFVLAAEMQSQSALEANRLGDVAGEVIGLFMNGIYQLKHALKWGVPIWTKPFLMQFDSSFERLVASLTGTALEIEWAQVNGPVFMIESFVWLDRKHPSWDEWVKTSLAGMEKLGSSWDLCAEFVRAVDMERQDPLAAESALSEVADSNDANERRAAALLILVRHAMKDGQVRQAKELIARMPKQGAQHVVAIAKSCLKEAK